jgi:cysteine sulfinate desulfinase/cysteine desulfurase-like protein
VVLKWVDVDANGDLDPQAVIDAIGPKTKLVAITHLSNVLGTIFDVKPVCDAAHARGVPVLVDGSAGGGAHAADLDELGAISTRSRATSSMGPPAPARSISSGSGWPRCAPSWAAAT